MSHPDENTSHLAIEQIERDREHVFGGRGAKDGGAHMEVRDTRMTGLIKWVWAVIGSMAVMVGVGVYNKLSSINDTLILAVSDIKNQGAQVSELKADVRDLRAAQAQLQRQVDSLEGKTLRGIEEMKRGH